jgi:hypothetical protein
LGLTKQSRSIKKSGGSKRSRRAAREEKRSFDRTPILLLQCPTVKPSHNILRGFYRLIHHYALTKIGGSREVAV